MKKISVIIITLLLVIVTLFGFAGCGSDNQSESQNKIDELQSKIQELENKLSELDEHNKELNTQIKEMDGQLHDYYERIEKLEKELYGSYNEAGGFYERETNDYISATFSFMASSVYGYCISVEHYNKNLKFLCSVEYGSFGSPGLKTVELKSGENCYWGFDNYMHESWNSTIYADVIAKNGEQIIGYGVIGFFKYHTGMEDKDRCKVLKFAVFPKVEGEYQTVSEDQIKKAMDEIKNNGTIPYERNDRLDDTEKQLFYQKSSMVQCAIEVAYEKGWLTCTDLAYAMYYACGVVYTCEESDWENGNMEAVKKIDFAPEEKCPAINKQVESDIKKHYFEKMTFKEDLTFGEFEQNISFRFVGSYKGTFVITDLKTIYWDYFTDVPPPVYIAGFVWFGSYAHDLFVFRYE